MDTHIVEVMHFNVIRAPDAIPFLPVSTSNSVNCCAKVRAYL
ncbi:MAG: hypothetical protein U0X92_04040 [Anaerolineales bacterium]